MIDVPEIAIAAVAHIVMPDHDRLRIVAVLAIALSAEEVDGRANGLDEAEIEAGCRARAEAQAKAIALMYAEE